MTMSQATIKIDADSGLVACHGNWSSTGVSAIAKAYLSYAWPEESKIIFDCNAIEHFDSAGAWILRKIVDNLSSHGKEVVLQDLSQEQQQLLSIVTSNSDTIKHIPAAEKPPNLLHSIGKETHTKYWNLNRFLTFTGEIVVVLARVLNRTSGIKWNSVLRVVYDTGFQALPIIALLTFLIGVVLAYQMGTQLEYYGANIYVVNVSGMAILREFGPLITAIIVSGRTGAAFTAQIGTMKVNQEIDALYAMGLSPIVRLVIPKIIGLMIALPLLTVWADGFGIMGAMVMSKSSLDIGYYDFLARLQEVIQLKTYTIGLSKAPVFALIIAAVGCFHGFQVSSSAESIGHQTTKSVVQAIFLIIIVDAIFSVMFSWQGI